MMRVDPNYVVKLAQAIGTSSAREQKLTNELSSGLRVASLSDDPVAASTNVALTSSLAHIDSFVQSSNREQSMLQVTDSALGDVVSQVTSALSLAVKATNGTLSSANLSAIGEQLAGLRDNVVSLANTSYLGTYVFAGSQGNTKPFNLDSTTTPATASYNGDTLTQRIETPDGQKVQTNVPGSDVFMAKGSDLLGALNKLVADVTAGSTGSLDADTATLTSALAAVSTQRGTIGSSLNRLLATTGYAQTQSTMLQARQSGLLSAEPASVASDLKTAEVQHQALLSVESALSQVNLFSYLK
jgi:flagellar hook-associated protein 3 FlgL